MNFELNRLQTFTDWPADAAISPQRIAKAGFYSTRRGCEVECFSCHVKISTWNYGDQVMARHKDANPSCPFVLDPSTSGNIPFISPLRSIVSPPVNLDYRDEAVRLASFENWPVPHIVTPESLARAGFYSLKAGDNTKCAYCKGVVRAWELGDVPDLEHKRHFPYCSFVQNTINPRTQGSSTSNSSNVVQDENIASLIQMRFDINNLNELGVQKHNGPKKVEYATEEARLRSFASWSPSLIQTPDTLAQAGFYYEGVGDQVRCFHCDGGLRHWDPDDDPWTEHARWFPSCSFIKLVKGQEFISACALDNTDQTNMGNNKASNSRNQREVTERELQKHLVGPAALAALRIGIDVQRVRRALKNKLRHTSEGYKEEEADSLVEAALTLQLEEDENDTDEDSRIREQVTAALSAVVKAAQADPTGQAPKKSAADNTSNSPISLEEENRMLRDARQCKICMDAEVGIVFLPCGHLATCVTCAPNLEDCPVCRSAIKATVRTFLS
ncbi:hypothetical protein GWI33_018695 [Rhynchophorus ferrugineus]|uniref:RING-type domain-containing protein n=2 Tax=Rhynchophorus TaxID=93127 RepID=A0A834HWC6_RHYFE|nr:hypothetical protein GWI33_018695 [Rhynchophorus ferrugineus]